MTAHLHDPVHGYSDPDRLWTTTNVAEATPDILTPLCWSVFGDGMERAWLDSMGTFGVLGRSEREISNDPNKRATAAVLGRQAVNIAVLRQVVARLPGVHPDDVERDIFGSVRSGIPKEPGAPRRIPVIIVKLPIAMLGIDRHIRAMYADQHRWWRAEVLEAAAGTPRSAAEAMARLEESHRRFAVAMTLHHRSRFLLSAAEKPVRDAFTRIGRPDDARELLCAYGGVAETGMADALYAVARDELSITEFLGEYGFHGPNEGNVYTRSWREEPERVNALVAGYRNRSDLRSPRAQEAEAIRARQARQVELMAALPSRVRPSVRFAWTRAAGMTRKLELGKAAYLMALDGARAAARELGAALAADDMLTDADDTFFLTVPELSDLTARRSDPATAWALVAYRRGQRELYQRIAMPLTWTGFPDVDRLVQQAADKPANEYCTSLVRGVAWGGGTVTGRARVIRNPHDDVELEAGDILVCRFTDPSWAPLFSMSEALVIDIGGAQSHGAVVARELGIPYVIGTDNGTDLIREGAVITVNGTNGDITVMADRSLA